MGRDKIMKWFIQFVTHVNTERQDIKSLKFLSKISNLLTFFRTCLILSLFLYKELRDHISSNVTTPCKYKLKTGWYLQMMLEKQQKLQETQELFLSDIAKAMQCHICRIRIWFQDKLFVDGFKAIIIPETVKVF
ncbi:hypothetical protein YC2023_089801 [Brassica napus]